jgi:hypothetical protein
MSDELQALCFMAGANSIFYGEKLLTTGNPDTEHDQRLFQRLGIAAEAPGHTRAGAAANAPLHAARHASPHGDAPLHGGAASPAAGATVAS